MALEEFIADSLKWKGRVAIPEAMRYTREGSTGLLCIRNRNLEEDVEHSAFIYVVDRIDYDRGEIHLRNNRGRVRKETLHRRFFERYSVFDVAVDDYNGGTEFDVVIRDSNKQQERENKEKIRQRHRDLWKYVFNDVVAKHCEGVQPVPMHVRPWITRKFATFAGLGIIVASLAGLIAIEWNAGQYEQIPVKRKQEQQRSFYERRHGQLKSQIRKTEKEILAVQRAEREAVYRITNSRIDFHIGTNYDNKEILRGTRGSSKYNGAYVLADLYTWLAERPERFYKNEPRKEIFGPFKDSMSLDFYGIHDHIRAADGRKTWRVNVSIYGGLIDLFDQALKARQNAFDAQAHLERKKYMLQLVERFKEP